MLRVCNRIIEYSFYSLFFLVPLVFTSTTSELFEFNKIWLTFALSIIIAGAWAVKSIVQRRIPLCRTPLDIPILLFLSSQIISTIFSLDQHVSLWGYYSRFNGGLLSILSYIFLYYAFVSNLESSKMVKRMLLVSLGSGLVVALWGLPSHFGYDPTCLIFRGTFDVSCWTDAFQPKVRIFSTLGQPNWLAAYLAILIPITIAFAIGNHKSKIKNHKQIQNQNSQNLKQFFNFKNWNLFGIWNLKFGIFFLASILFYVDLLFTRSQSGFLGLTIGLLFFGVLYFFWQKQSKLLLSLALIFVFITFFVGQPISQLDKFTFEGIKNRLTAKTAPETASPKPPTAGELGGTDSGKIRMIVWQGAIDIFKNSPAFGTGVETFAFAYYKYRPAAHNLVSEWDYLYNKAHNEYLNYLATTGAFGLGTYLLMIGGFLFLVLKKIKNQKSKIKSTIQNSKIEDNYTLDAKHYTLILALLASYLSILVSNFFGFSVVIVNVYLFMIPAFVFILNNMIDPEKSLSFPGRQEKNDKKQEVKVSSGQWVGVSLLLLISFFLLLTLFRFRQADKDYALGYNLDKMGDYQTAYPKLESAFSKRADEPMILDEFSINNAVLAVALLSQKDIQPQTASMASVLAQRAVQTSDLIVKEHPNNVVFWKTRTRLFYALSQIDKQYLSQALSSIQKAHELAPTDAKISYNLGLLYGQNGNGQKAIEQLKKTIKLKPDYRDAYYALSLFYRDLSMNKEATETMRYILDHFSKDDAQATQALKTWGEM